MGRPPSDTRKLLRLLRADELREMIGYYGLERVRDKESMIDRLVATVGGELETLVSAEGPWRVREWSNVLEELGGSRRKTFEAVRDELSYLLDPVFDEFDVTKTVASIREDDGAIRRLAGLLGINVRDVKDAALESHGKLHLWRFVAKLRGDDEENDNVEATSSETAVVAHVGEPAAKVADAIPPAHEAAVRQEPAREAPVKEVSAAIGSGAIERFEEFLLVERLRGGGMSEVWRAEDPNGERVFLKRAHLPGFDARALEREQNIYQKLVMRSFPHIVGVRAYRKTNDYVFLVTDFVPGGTLKTYVDEAGGELKGVIAKSIAKSVAAALAALHGEGVVHRDIKPQNILRASASWYLADFGIAKSLDRLMTHHTLATVGTRGYMAPEQRGGADAHPAADVFSFGKILAYMLTGHTDVDMIVQEPWWNLASKCTARTPAERPESADLAGLLDAIAV